MVAQALLIAVPFLGMLAAICKPRMNVLGVQRPLHPALNIDRCEPVHGLEACEDAWVHHDSGLAYLACSSLTTRAHWSPSMETLDARALPTVSTDSLRLFSFTSRTHTALALVDLPAAHPGLWVHGMDALHTPTGAEPDLYTLFVVSHRPPRDRAQAPREGADSVVEIFETVLGSETARWVGTVRDELVRTPNSVVATGRRSFYVSNDHTRKVHWTRKFELAYVESSEVAHCTLLSSGSSSCTVAAPGLSYPNGLAKGPDDLLYVASTYTGEVNIFEIQHADMSLVPVGSIWLERTIDNLHVSPSTGAVYAATFPKFLSFSSAAPTPSSPRNPVTKRAPVEIWRIANETNPDEVFLGRKWKKEVVLSDPQGEVVSAVTTAAPWRDEVLLTGFFTPHAVVCKMGEVL
ncbi:hypothetical protein JCM10449v2_004512 [Rhodotorula kratochvilovae]